MTPDTALSAFTTEALQAEISRRTEHDAAEMTRALAKTVARQRLVTAVTVATRDLSVAEDEHGRRKLAHAGLVAQGLNVRAEDLYVSEIRISQANSARVEARDRLLQAERGLDSFDAGAR